MNTDTIAAISTPVGTGGIGIIRVSGDAAIETVDRIFSGKRRLAEANSHTITFGHIVNLPQERDVTEGSASSVASAEDKETIDEVLVSVFRAPHSYTTEDVVEIQSHGGMYVMQRILGLLFSCGIRPADAGEFTKRAFLGGRIDLSQAEAVMDVIGAQNERMLRNSERQLSGVLSKAIGKLRGEILHETAYIEAALDDPEHYDLSNYPSELKDKIILWRRLLQDKIDGSSDGQLLKEGIRTVIIGKPNVGKSSLLNALIGSDRAIVTEIPGTTRDVLEESVRLGDISLVITDTAGIRDTSDAIEQMGIERALKAAEDADLILYVADASMPLDENDRRIVRGLAADKTLVLLNKSDKEEMTSAEDVYALFSEVLCERENPIGAPKDKVRRLPRVFFVSAKEHTGLDTLSDAVSQLVFSDYIRTNDDFFITNLRHTALLKQADVSLSLVEQSIIEGQPEDFFSIDLMDAYRALGEIIGEEVEDDLAEKIFKDFCMGK